MVSQKCLLNRGLNFSHDIRTLSPFYSFKCRVANSCPKLLFFPTDLLSFLVVTNKLAMAISFISPGGYEPAWTSGQKPQDIYRSFNLFVSSTSLCCWS